MHRFALPLALVGVLLASSPVLLAQEGGLVTRLCDEDCTDDAFEIVFADGMSTYQGPLEPGAEVPVRVVIDTATPGIQGFSYGVAHDPDVLELVDVTTEGTVVDPESPDSAAAGDVLDFTGIGEGGFLSGIVLSTRQSVELPVGRRNVVCLATYRLLDPSACSLVRLADQAVAPAPGAQGVDLNITADAKSGFPRTLRHGLIGPSCEGLYESVCDDGVDNNSDGFTDCEAVPCADHPACKRFRVETCDDGLDNDRDGLTDCEDGHCQSDPACPEDCGDGLDNDGDGLADCDDPVCRRRAPCWTPEVCDDGLDNDGDGRTDCEDTSCTVACRERCDDGIDNDQNGLTDCDDPDCARQAPCRTPEICDDGLDNNGDGLADCDDPLCRIDPACPEDCADGIDNDGDGDIDCEDTACTVACREICNDGLDNDGDGLTDCEDSNCRLDPACPEDCGDGIDNDGDGDIDCEDTRCTAACLETTCDDGLDNDQDGLTDCDDPNCKRRVPCRALEICDDGVDNDQDGLTDCEDSRCRVDPACSEDCEDGIDNDQDGLIDCQDPRCRGRSACIERCFDGLDNDVDGLTDCDDPRCPGVGDCPFGSEIEGGARRVFCEGGGCIGASFRIVFANGRSNYFGVLTPETEVAVRVVLRSGEAGVTGWSYGVRHDPSVIELLPERVTTAGTITAPDPDVGLAPPDFELTTAVEDGFVSVVLFDTEQAVALPVNEYLVVGKAAYRPRTALDQTRLQFVSGELGPPGEAPVEIALATGDVARPPEEVVDGFVVQWRTNPFAFNFFGPGGSPPALPETCDDGSDNNGDGLVDCDDPDCRGAPGCGVARGRFRRGDVDGNGRIDVSDARRIIRLAVGSPEPPFDCRSARDANDDGILDVRDALPLLAWVFLRGDALPAPFLECGTDDDCAESSPGCR